MEKDIVSEAVFDFLENGGDLPAEADKNPQNRFMFQSAMTRLTYQRSCEAISTAREAANRSKDNVKVIQSFKEVIDVKMGALVDKVDVRLGLIGGIIIVANVALVFLVRVWP